MTTHGRGLVCLAMTAERLDELDIPLMVAHSGGRCAVRRHHNGDCRAVRRGGAGAGARPRPDARDMLPLSYIGYAPKRFIVYTRKLSDQRICYEGSPASFMTAPFEAHLFRERFRHHSGVHKFKMGDQWP